MKKNFVIALASVPLGAIFLCSCASGQFSNAALYPVPQSETREVVDKPWGVKVIYKDLSGHPLRIEKRGGPDDTLLPGICTIQFNYGTNGALATKQYLNSAGQLTCNTNGYAITKYAYPVDSTGQPVVEETFFDENQQPVATKSGFAMMTCTENKDGRVNTAHFSDFQSRPAPSTWFGVSNVVDVQYFYLQGVTPIVCGVFRDASGNILDRKQMKGLTAETSVETETDPTYDAPAHSAGSHHH